MADKIVSVLLENGKLKKMKYSEYLSKILGWSPFEIKQELERVSKQHEH